MIIISIFNININTYIINLFLEVIRKIYIIIISITNIIKSLNTKYRMLRKIKKSN